MSQLPRPYSFPSRRRSVNGSPLHRHRVHVTAQRQPAGLPRPNDRVQVRLRALRIGADPVKDPESIKITPNEIDKVEVRVPACGVEGH